MRQAMARGTRRDLRRAVGVAALDTLQQLEEGVGSLGLAVNQVRKDVTELARDHAMFKKHTESRIWAHEVSSDGTAGKLDTFRARTRTCWGRLRWLLTGQ